ncbi:endonuclease/exonuclease/phosphatase family protein [Luteolibacter sp. LG18]|uniref:endonuclease/exonuclease/phosphatase family protein n=1 Tax=Luteolibacter sp. LG18 TaxID=2819286 RepID=UPI002B2EA606|nr:metallophosphoesterase [Luteolibacter sp. LG18]
MKVILTLLTPLLLAVPCRGAEGSKALRVVSWNLHHGEGSDGKQDLARIAAVIQSQEPDVVVLQEVDNKCKRSGGVDQAAELARLTNLQYVFGKAMDHDGGEYGQAILSRFPLSDLKIHKLPGEGEPRIAISARTETPFGPLTVAGVHLDYGDPARQLVQAQVASAALLEVSTGPIVLAGDFNATAESKTLAVFSQAPWIVVPKSGSAATEPAVKPDKEIDFTVVKGLRPVKPTVVVAETAASDHRPIVTAFAKPE